MLNKIINSIKNHTFLNIIKSKIRIVLRIKNRNVYDDYLKCKEYEKLYNKYKNIINLGVDETLKKAKSNIIWVCWLQGIENAPELVRACINSLKSSMKEKEIIILTNDNINKYIELPNYIINKWKRGIIPNAQYSDIIRTALLCKYGGCWIDATVLCTANKFPNYIEENDLFVYKQIDLYGFDKDLIPILASNWFIYSETNNPILLLTLELLYNYWKDNNRLRHYLIYHLFFAMACRRYPEIWNKIPVFNNHSPHTMQFELLNNYSKERWNQLKKISDFHKLNRRLKSDSNKKTIYNYIIDNYL